MSYKSAGRVIPTSRRFEGQKVVIVVGEDGLGDDIFQLAKVYASGFETIETIKPFPDLPAAREYVINNFLE